MRFNTLKIAAIALIFASCTPDDPDPVTTSFTGGVFITNEGAFQGGNGTLTYYDPSNMSTQQDVFLSQVGRPLGNVVNSATIHGGNILIAVNNSGVVEVASANDLSQSATITGFTSPRHIMGIDQSHVAVTDWGTGSVEIINMLNFGTSASIDVGNGPERMLVDGNRLYVANSGGFSMDSTVVMIDITTQTAIDTFYVGINPNSMIIDINGDMWVLCGGYTDWQNSANNREGSLYKINPLTGAVLDNFTFSATPRPTGLVLSSSNQTMYFLDNGYGGEVYSMDINEASLPTTALLTNVNGYALAYDAANNEIYVADPVDYASQGKVYRYDVATDAVIDTITTGIIPGCVVFN